MKLLAVKTFSIYKCFNLKLHEYNGNIFDFSYKVMSLTILYVNIKTMLILALALIREKNTLPFTYINQSFVF